MFWHISIQVLGSVALKNFSDSSIWKIYQEEKVV